MGGTPSPPRYRRGGPMFPVLLIVLGILLLLDQLLPGWGIDKTWPALLVAIGIIMLLDLTRPPRPPQGPRV